MDPNMETWKGAAKFACFLSTMVAGVFVLLLLLVLGKGAFIIAGIVWSFVFILMMLSKVIVDFGFYLQRRYRSRLAP